MSRKREKEEKNKKKTKVETEAKYEISMYKLITIVIIGLFVFMGIGFLVGNRIGAVTAIDSAKLPEYCAIYKSGGQVEVRCTELNVPADKFCEMLSPALEKQVKVVLITS